MPYDVSPTYESHTPRLVRTDRARARSSGVRFAGAAKVVHDDRVVGAVGDEEAAVGAHRAEPHLVAAEAKERLDANLSRHAVAARAVGREVPHAERPVMRAGDE